MRIANPIYDTFFKYMIANVEIAKYIIENLLDKKVIKLQPLQQEKVIHSAKELKIIRYDYSCTVELHDGTHKNIIVELQKSENKLDIGRFRGYLAKNYKEESVLNDGQTDYLPIIAIYFLGFDLQNTRPFIKAECNLIDLNTNEILDEEKDKFIQKLSHDIYLVQIKRINKNAEDRLSRMFSMFNQNYKAEHNNKYKDAVLDIPEEQIQSGNKNIFMHLHNMLESSEVMDDFEEARRIEKIMLKDEELRFLEGKAEGKIESAQAMLKAGLDKQLVQQILGLSEEQIEQILL